MPIEEKIRKYHELTELHKQVDHFFGQFLATIGRDFPDKIEDVKRRLAEFDFIEAITPIWAEHFSEEELDALIAFYESPVGRKVTSTRMQMAGRQQALLQKLVFEVMGIK